MSFDTREKHQSQVPALQLLIALGYAPLSQAEALARRGGRLRNVILDDVLVEELLRHNSFTYRGREYPFDLEDAHEAIRRLKLTPDQQRGLKATNQDIYDTLVLGTTITKTIDGDSKSYSFRFVDWKRPKNNVFHVTAEMSVERMGGVRTKRCDIVCFVNGIPFVVIENKRPTESLKKADSQLIGYQREDMIPRLFHFAQILAVMKRSEARYATVGASRKFWHGWRDQEDRDETVAGLANRPLTNAEKDALFSGDFAGARGYFDELAAEGARAVTEQDQLIHALFRPERLLDLVRRFTVFDGGARKIARHQQYFGVKKALARVKQFDDAEARRKGGVVWHTQGSGKSLSMVMLGRALALDPEILNPRLILVTDRDELDTQIRDTFKSCEVDPIRARSGAHLLSLIENRAPLVTTIVNKFENAAKEADGPDNDTNLFILVDESHRTQTGRYGGHGQFAQRMRRLLPKACYLGFTGTPLLKKERNTFASFGATIDAYKIDNAVADEAVTPLLYEGRLVEQQVAGDAIDRWFEKISEGLTDEQKADLKRKFSRMGVLSKTGQAIRAKAFDISEHYRRHWQGTGYKAQLVAPTKASAIRFKEVLDEIGHVSSEIIISPPSENEGDEEVDSESTDLVRRFWDRMMARYKSETVYNRQIIDGFKSDGDPEILIVVSKLLTGFDAPRNTVLYLCKPLREHSLLQAIARVNRLCDEGTAEKEFGFIIDYEGLLGELDRALSTYGALDGFDAEELAGTAHDVRVEIRKLPQRREALWDLFKSVANQRDMEQFEQLLADEALREDFYGRLKAFSRCLHMALSSDKLLDVFTEAEVERFKNDWRQFVELKRSVQLRFQEVVDLKDFEPKIQKLLDDYVVALPAEQIIKLVNINDPHALQAVIEETKVSTASKADRIASATRRTITEKMEQDPSFYQRFSKLLEQAIEGYRNHRISERGYLIAVADLAGKVARKERGHALPKRIRGDDDAEAFFEALREPLRQGAGAEIGEDTVADIALKIIEIVKAHHIVDIWSNELAQNNLRNAIDDYCFDVLRDQKNISLSEADIDALEGVLMRLAQARFPG